MNYAVRYESRIPQSLKAWIERNKEKVFAVDYASGFNTDSGWAYDILLRNGWSVQGEALHTIIEPTIKDTLAKLRGVERCDCEQCQNDKSTA